MTNCSFSNWLHDTQRRVVTITEEESEKYLTLGPKSAIMITVVSSKLIVSALAFFGGKSVS